MSEDEYGERTSAYAPLSEVAVAYGVSVDTIRRRMKRGEIEGRKETTPQGFRWLAPLPPVQPSDSSSISTIATQGVESTAQHELIASLQRELELRNQEIARLHEVVESQAHAIEHMAAVTPVLPSSVSGKSESTQEETGSTTATLWQRVRQIILG